MKPIEFEGQTQLLGPPREAKRGEVGALPIVRQEVNSQPAMSSFWKPSPEDLEQLQQGGQVRLIVYGFAHPPVWLCVDRVVELP